MEEIQKRALKQKMAEGLHQVHQNKDLRDLLEMATNKTVKTGLKAFKIFNFMQMVRAVIIGTIWYSIIIGATWYTSAYVHESNIINACKKGKSFNMLHSDYVISSCVQKK